MIDLYLPAQVREMDARAIAAGRTLDGRPGGSLDLMERAAGHIARAVVATGGRGYGLRVGMACGKGNNGGDGLAAARRLLDAGAAPVAAVVTGADGLQGDAAEQLRRFRARGGRVVDDLGEALAGADVVVDCLLGTGASGEPRPPYGHAVRALNDHPAPTVACDLPSGVDPGTGAVPGDAVQAAVTVTLGAHKRGLWLWPARSYCGRLLLGDLGIADPAGDAPAARVLEPADAGALVPDPLPGVHKRSRGVVVAVAGSPGMAGAATLVARGAMAAGAGLVTVASRAATGVAPTVPEALTAELPEEPDAAFDRVASEAARADALAVGPGLGRSEEAFALIRRIVGEIDLPIVLDADGINAFRHDGAALARSAGPLLVATPHAAEYARLFAPDEEEDPWGRRADVAPDRAAAWQAVLVVKGPGTVVAAPDGRVWVNATGGPALATGGSGDVLTGMLAALVAQQPRADVVAAGVHLHGLAGQRAGQGLRARAVTALDVARAVPAALCDLEEARR